MLGLICSARICRTRWATSPLRSGGGRPAAATAGLGLLGLMIAREPRIRFPSSSMVAPRSFSALAAERLGLAHNPSEAAAAARDKAAMRRAFAAAGLPQPEYRIAGPRADVAILAAEVGSPCVVKPLSLSASRGAI